MTKKIIVSNPTNLQTIDYHKLKILQGDLKTLSQENLTKLCNSIKRYNFFAPAFVWKSGDDLWILDATQRYHALEQLEKEGCEIPEIPYIEIEAKDRKDAAEKLLQITSRYGTINEETTFFEDFDIDLSFIENIEIPELDIKLDELESEIVEDEVPEPPIEPLSKTGDLWLCGKHRVLCGDATKEADIERLMDGKKADMVMTSPPYWLGKEYEREKTISEIDLFIKKFCELCSASMSKNASRVIINTGTGWNQRMNDKNEVELILLADKYINNLKQFNWFCRHIRIWSKRGSLPATAPHPDYIDIHWEFILTFYNTKTKYRGQNKLDNLGKAWALEGIWSDIKGDSNQQGHTASYPIEIPYRNILLYSLEDEIIYDAFLGSGTTLIACEQLKRICYGCEIDPHYTDVILDRYAKYTGDDPIRESDNVKWSELKSSKVV